MNAISRVTVFGLAIAVATGFALSQGQLLRLKLAEDSKDVYDVKMTGDTTIDVPGMGSQSVNFTGSMKYTIKVGKKDAESGKFAIEFITSDMQFESDMGDMGAMPGMDREMIVTGKIDDRYRISDVKNQSSNAMFAMATGSMSSFNMGIELPEGPVKVGDSWEVTVPPNPAMPSNKPAKLNATLLGEQVRDGLAVWEIAIKGEIDIDIDTSKMEGAADAMQGMNAKVTGKVALTGKTYLAKETGKLVSSELSAKSTQVTELVDMGMTMNMEGTMKQEMKLKK
ncbi:MAG: hypothetical protein DCC46_06680 [Armatimonadetes bacterium]|nr:MAG: hypothetical protein DCC46_06680 [Armatimonadota bacterium]